jgi:hypothetical protein
MKPNNLASTQLDSKDVWIALVLAIFAGCVFYPFASLRCDAHHDGVMLKPALDVLSGQVLFRDTFTQYGPLTTYLQAGALAIKPTLLSIRLLAVAAQAGALTFFYLAWRGVLPRSIALVAAAFYLAWPMFYLPFFFMLPWSSTVALFFQSIALFALTRLVAGGSGGPWGWLLGIGCACTFWCRQPVGGFLTVGAMGCATVLWLSGWKPADGWIKTICRVVAGGLAVSVLILGHLAINGAVHDWWMQNVIWPRSWAAGVGETGFGRFVANLILTPAAAIPLLVLIAMFLPSWIRHFYVRLPRWTEWIWWFGACCVYWAGGDRWLKIGLVQLQRGWSLLVIGIVAILAIGLAGRAMWAWMTKRALGREFHLIAALTGVALVSLPQLYPMMSANHVFWAVAPGIGVLLYGVYRLSRLSAHECALGLLLILSVVIYDRYRWGLYTATQPYVRLESPAVLSGLRVDTSQAEALARIDAVVTEVLAAEPAVEVILYGDDALYLSFFNNRENPSPYYVTWPGLLTEADILQRREYVTSRRPVVLVNGSGLSQLKSLPGDYRQVLHEPELALKIYLPGWLRERMAANTGKPATGR